MPELPEVETVRLDLEAQLLNKKIKKIEVLNPGTVGGDAINFSSSLVNTSFSAISRRGKLLIFTSSHRGLFLLAHLKMTGQLIYRIKNQIIAGGHSLSSHSFDQAVGGELPSKHTRLILSFSDGSNLFFNDIRKFGYLKLVNSSELAKIVNNYGPEPLDKLFILSDFTTRLKKRRISIKAALLDQKLVAGIGNIYVDEILFASGVRPERSAASLTTKEISKIYQAIKKILALAIVSRGTTFSNYVDGSGNKGNFSQYLQVYGRGDLSCLKCGLAIIKTKVAGRGTHYCEHCQS